MSEMIDAVYFDFQGTLVDVRGIRFLLKSEKRNFDAFHWATANCPPNPGVVSAARKAHADGLAVLFGTGMNEHYKRVATWWLADHQVHVDEFEMRKDNDFRKDVVVKCEMRDRWKQIYNIVHAYDDRPDVVRDVWEADGIPCTKVPGWEEAWNE